MGIHHRSRGGNARRLRRVAPTKRPQPPHQTRRLRALRAPERVRLIEHHKLQLRRVEQLHVPLPRQQQLELLPVRQQDARLLAGDAHLLA